MIGDQMACPGPADDEVPDHVDVLIVGAGLSGVGAACRLRTELPGRRLVVLESREALGGTWDLFRYPGVRSDSDMFTLGYAFRPWTGATSLADGDSIRSYIEETAREHGVDQHIRYRRRVTALSWDSGHARWTAEVERTDTGQIEHVTAGFVYSCTGYYRYDEGYTPSFPGTERFRGRIVHPQHWPEDLDPTGQRFVVIGSGATAVTLVPALAADAAHVTMLQRSPSYVISLPGRDVLADAARWFLPAEVASGLIRWKNVLVSATLFQLSRRAPGLVRRFLRWRVEQQLPADFDTATHFTPTYDPWDQRLCLVPDNDLFRALGSGDASIVTDTIDTFTEEGVTLGSGRTLDADVIVTATGLHLLALGGIRIVVDGEPVAVSETVAYKGMMLSGVPNLAFAIGYTNASWTLRVDLVSNHVCRMLAYMDARGYDQVTARRPEGVALRPLIDLDSGYVRRSVDQLPKQADRDPWRVHQSYVRDVRSFPRTPVDDEGIRFTRSSAVRPTATGDVTG